LIGKTIATGYPDLKPKLLREQNERHPFRNRIEIDTKLEDEEMNWQRKPKSNVI
jgi:hypothetical protein